MILTCNSCKKKFVVPDQAITAAGRTVQCGSCGSKWKQFPIKNEINNITAAKNVKNNKISSKTIAPKTPKPKQKKKSKTREINLYSPEYLAKKHGISLHDVNSKNNTSSNKIISFGFYNYLILFFVVVIALSRGLYFFQDFITEALPFTKFYVDYFFETMKNIFEIWKNLISSY